MRSFLLLVLAPACGFSIPGGGVQPIDDAPPGSDGTGAEVLPSACPWTYDAEYVEPCPAIDAPPIELLTGKYTLDTSTGTLVTGIQTVDITSEIVADVRIVWTRGLHVADGATLRVIGEHPLAIISTGAMTIDGVVDAGSHANDLVLENGPGANPPACNTDGAFVGQPCGGEGASGGGGGGFGGLGGQGGYGGDGRSCGMTDGVPGGSGGAALLARPSSLRGGCSGAAGGFSLQPGATIGLGGRGGGALALVARDTLTIGGHVTAGGSGGHGSRERAGGGGGGSGGMIVLEAFSIQISSMGRVAANGGGGGGGADHGAGMPGADGATGNTQAAGGDGQGEREGGNGAGGAVSAGAGELTDRGAGGGGGSVGFIRVHNGSAAGASNNGVISPMPSG